MQLRIEHYIKGRGKPVLVLFPDTGYSSVMELRRVMKALYGHNNDVEAVAGGVSIRHRTGPFERRVVRLEGSE